MATSRKQRKIERLSKDAEEFGAEVTAQPVMWDEYGLEGDNDGRAYGIHFTDGYEVYDVHWFATAKERDAYMKEYNEDFSAETFNAENEIMVHQLISPYETGGYSTTYIYRDEKDLMNAIWHDHACERMEYYQDEHPEYDWDGYIDSDENRAIFDKKTKDMSIDEILEYSDLDYNLYYKKIPLNLEGFSVDGKYGEIRNLTRNSGILRAETFNAPAAVMRTYKGRKSPSISAKSVKVGTRKRGNDGKMWQVRSVKSRGKRTQRWFKD